MLDRIILSCFAAAAFGGVLSVVGFFLFFLGLVATPYVLVIGVLIILGSMGASLFMACLITVLDNW